MQDYEQYARISRAPVIIPPAGAAPQQEEPASPVPPQEPEETNPIPDLFRALPRRAVGKKRSPADRLLLVQWIICGLALAALLFLRSSSPAMFENMRGWYNEQLHREITVQVETPENTN